MKRIPTYKFNKHKYGDELLVDVISYDKKIYLETSEAGCLLYSFLGFRDIKDMMHLTFK